MTTVASEQYLTIREPITHLLLHVGYTFPSSIYFLAICSLFIYRSKRYRRMVLVPFFPLSNTATKKLQAFARVPILRLQEKNALFSPDSKNPWFPKFGFSDAAQSRN
jgi:hypothetical protein